MANYAVPEENLTAIADAIRLKSDSAAPITVEDMPLAISLIDGGGGASAFDVTFSDSTNIVQIPQLVGHENFVFYSDVPPSVYGGRRRIADGLYLKSANPDALILGRTTNSTGSADVGSFGLKATYDESSGNLSLIGVGATSAVFIAGYIYHFIAF